MASRLGRLRGVAIVIGVLGTLALVGIGFVSLRPVFFPTIEPDLSSYPGAASVQDVALPSATGPDTRLITFTTTDAPTAVIAYYDASLVPKHWRKNGSQPGSGAYVLEVAECQYFLRVTTSGGPPRADAG